jgi:hypothetical protein
LRTKSPKERIIKIITVEKWNNKKAIQLDRF